MTDATDLPLGPGELAEKLGITITELTDERIVATMPVAGNRQPFGLLHGGASAALAETVGSILGFRLAGEGRAAVGVELNCSHHRSARNGSVTAVGMPLHVGRSLGSFEITVTDDQHRRICTCRLTVAYISTATTP